MIPGSLYLVIYFSLVVEMQFRIHVKMFTDRYRISADIIVKHSKHNLTLHTVKYFKILILRIAKLQYYLIKL